jgi:hypothetical protein
MMMKMKKMTMKRMMTVIKLLSVNRNTGERMLGIGLTARNLELLKQDRPIEFTAGEMTLDKIEVDEVVIFYGETEESIYTHFKDLGLLKGTQIIVEKNQ